MTRSLILASSCLVSLLATPARAQTWHGLYTDATTYQPGDAVEIYTSAPETKLAFRLVRLDEDWTEIVRTAPIDVGPQPTLPGSFLEVDGLDLAGRESLTLEGWIHPTIVGGDLVAVAGQLGETESAAGLLILPDGRPAAYLSDEAKTDPRRALVGDVVLEKDRWAHLAMTWDGATLRLFHNGQELASRAQAGRIAEVAAPFRIGARAEAPGDLTGIFDGRVDAWAVWPRALGVQELRDRLRATLDGADPTPAPRDVDLFLGFEEDHPTIRDHSAAHNRVVAVNHGTAGVAGVPGEGRAMRLNHDQVVDAGWELTTALTIPADAPSGFYAVQALPGPDYAPTRGGDRLAARAFAVRPADGAARNPIAVVVPTYTWMAYNAYPGHYAPVDDGITPRGRDGADANPRPGGVNSAYAEMGDGMSYAHFHGWRRPSREASPVLINEDLGWYGLRAPMSWHMVRWLDAHGFDYDVYSDDDLHAGRVRFGEHRVLLPHGHHEYWTDAMLAAMSDFLEDGGSVVAPSGNMMTWRTVVAGDGVVEVRKFSRLPVLGVADIQSGVDGGIMGTRRQGELCTGNDDHLALGVQNHLIKPCSDQPRCFGRWRAEGLDHWLWQGLDIDEGAIFGDGPAPGAGAVGHETDSWQPGMFIPGLAEGAAPIVLGSGTDFDADDPGGRILELGAEPPYDCEDMLAHRGPPSDEGHGVARTTDDSGTILTFPHESGGQVLAIGASATPWAIHGDPVLSSLLERGLTCFVEGGCDEAPEEPNPPREEERGCGCSTGTGASWWAFLVLPALLVASRRRGPPSPQSPRCRPR